MLIIDDFKSFRVQEDLEAVESRYKVDAKPEPYKPPNPAPLLDDDPPPLQTSKVPLFLEKKPDKVRESFFLIRHNSVINY